MALKPQTLGALRLQPRKSSSRISTACRDAIPLPDMKLFSREPWYLAGSFRDQTLLQEYTVAGYLLDGTPIEGLETSDWSRHVVLPASAIVRRTENSSSRAGKILMAEAPAALTKRVYQRSQGSPCGVRVPYDLDLDQYLYGTQSEAQYGRALSTLGASVPE